jgi:hypothetical protein
MGSCSEPLAQLARELKCALCQQFFDQPVSLPCAHVFCSRCIRAALEGRGVFRTECPTCKLPAFVKDLSKNTKVAAVTALLRGLLEPAAVAACVAPQPQPSCAGRGGGSGSGAAASSGDGRRKRASPDAASPRLPDGVAAGKRARGGKSSSDAPASPPPESDGCGGADASGGAAEQSESHESHDSQVGADLLAWAAHQRSLPTPTSSECDALLEDAKTVRAAQAVIAARLRRLEQHGAGARGATAAAPRAHGRAGSSLRLEESAPCEDGVDSGAAASLLLSRAGRAGSVPSSSLGGGGGEADPRLSVAEMQRRCVALFGRVFDAKKMRRELAKVHPDSLRVALQAADGDAAEGGESEETPAAAGDASGAGGAAADTAAEEGTAADADAVVVE